MTAQARPPSGERLSPAKISDRLLRQALKEAEIANQRVIELTQQVIELTAENAELRAQIGLLQGKSTSSTAGQPEYRDVK